MARLSFPDPPPSPPAGAPVLVANPPAVTLGPEVFNRADVHRATVPAVGAISNARSLARLFAVYAGRGLLAGRRYADESAIADCLTPRPDFDGPDLTYGRRLPLGLGGVWIEAPGVVPAGHGAILAHPGAGGSIAWAELDAGLAVAICHDRMFASAAELSKPAVLPDRRRGARDRGKPRTLKEERMMTLTLEDRAEIHDLYARYAHAFDGADAEAWAALFMPEGRFSPPGIEPVIGNAGATWVRRRTARLTSPACAT